MGVEPTKSFVFETNRFAKVCVQGHKSHQPERLESNQRTWGFKPELMPSQLRSDNLNSGQDQNRTDLAGFSVQCYDHTSSLSNFFFEFPVTISTS